MGAEGSLVCSDKGEGWRIPALPTAVVDVTGAGNAYCGGFLVGLGEGHDALESACRAAVGASYALRQFGIPSPEDYTARESERALQWCREHTRPVP